MAQSKNNIAELSRDDAIDRTIVLTRIFDAPRDLVFKVWTQPEHMMQWLGPHEFAATDIKVDLRVGGAWRACIRSPEGKDYWMHGVYREVAAPRRLVLTHVWEPGHDSPAHETLITLTFEDLGDKTKMIFRKAVLENVVERASQQNGWSESLYRLNAYIRKLRNLPDTKVSELDIKSTGKTTVLTRTFDAPRTLVFQAWIEPRHILKWFYATDGWTTPFAETDPRPGGTFRIGFKSPDGKDDFTFAGIYDEVQPPARLVYTIEGGRPVWLTFTEQDGKTTLRLELTLEATHSEALQREGWGQMLGHLSVHLAGHLRAEQNARR